MRKETRKLIQKAEAQGFKAKPTKNSHHVIRSPRGDFVTVLPESPSDHRGLLNAKAALRRFGFRDEGGTKQRQQEQPERRRGRSSCSHR